MPLRVMIVDDALFMRNILKDIFLRAGFEVVAEASDQPASEIVARVARAIDAYRGDAPPNDDSTIVVLRITN